MFVEPTTYSKTTTATTTTPMTMISVMICDDLLRPDIFVYVNNICPVRRFDDLLRPDIIVDVWLASAVGFASTFTSTFAFVVAFASTFR